MNFVPRFSIRFFVSVRGMKNYGNNRNFVNTDTNLTDGWVNTV